MSTLPSGRDDSASDALETRPIAARSEDVRANTSAGRYVLLEEVGTGGMGRVSRAYDPKLHREVALKEVHAEAVDLQAAQRLVAEARAMAQLNHPNVVSVYDVEQTTGGGLIVVMEFVDGPSLKEWLADGPHAWEIIVEHFVQAGHGLASAHRAGLLHRDFKPANVLVAQGSSGARVMVTDFGLAKAAPGFDRSSSDLIEAVAAEVESSVVSPAFSRDSSDDLTRAGTVMGTPRYMAPEQHDGQTLTAAADQYAFCVALWGALAGEPPFGGDSMVADKHRGPPDWSGADVPASLVRALRRGLSPRPGDRWPSMQELLAVLAHDTRRRGRWLGVAGSMVGVGLAAAVVSMWAQHRAERCTGAEAQLAGVWDDGRRGDVRDAMLGTARAYARDVWTHTKATLDRYREDWIASYTDACVATTIRGEQSHHVMDLQIACLLSARQGLIAVTNVLVDADGHVVEHAHEIVAGLAPLQHCMDIEALQAGVDPPRPDEADAVDIGRQQLARTRAELGAGRYPRAQAALTRAETLLGDVTYAPACIELLLVQGQVCDILGDYAGAEVAYRGALEKATSTGDLASMQRAAAHLLVEVGTRLQRPDEALQRYELLATSLRPADSRARAHGASSLASVLYTQGQYTLAEEAIRRALALEEAALGPEDLRLADSLNSLGGILAGQGKYVEAEAEFRRALVMREVALGSEHPVLAGSRNNLAIVLFERGKFAEAEAEHRGAIALREAAVGPGHPEVALSRDNLANALHAQGRHAEAETEHRLALALLEAAVGPEHPYAAGVRNNLANALHAQGKYVEAEAELRRALLVQAPDHPHAAEVHDNLASALQAQGKNDQAEAELRASLRLREGTLGPEHPSVAVSNQLLGALLLEQGRLPEARSFAERAWAVRGGADTIAQDRGETAFLLARTLWDDGSVPGERARACELASRAAEAFASAGSGYETAETEVLEWLDTHRVD